MRVLTREGFLSVIACIFFIMVGSSVDENLAKLLIGITGGVVVNIALSYMYKRIPPVGG